MSVNKKSVVSNMMWRFAERCGAQGVSFIVSVVLARMLLPEEYGIVSIITIFTTILNLFIDSGFKNALIQKKNADQLDFSTVFYFNIFMGVVMYLLMFMAAVPISVFYEKEYMVPYIRVMSLVLIVGGVNGVQTAIVSRRMEFKRFFYSTLVGTVISAVVGIAMAYAGMGVWALIVQRLVNQCIDTCILWFTVKWRPSLVFSFKRLKPMFSYGSKLLGSSLLNSLNDNLVGLIIGKAYTADMLAFYDKGKRIPIMLVENLQTAVQSVLFPVLAQYQDEKMQLRRILRISFMTAAYCIFPCMMGIGVCAEPIIRLLFTEKWIEMVPYLQLWCFVYAFYLLHTAHLQIIQAVGRSDIFLKIEIVKQILALAATLLSIPFGVLTMLKAMCLFTVISLFINAFPNRKLANYAIREQLRDILPIVILNIIMGLAVYLVSLIKLSDILQLFLQIVFGSVVYLIGSKFFKLESFEYIRQLVSSFLRKYKKIDTVD